MSRRNANRRVAITNYALTLCRNVLYDVRDGKVNMKDIEKVLDITTLQHLSQTMNISEDDMYLNWEDVLHEDEKQKML
jgi:ABC-type uncharacterized transport system fused permease/ATPase subunit